MKNVICRIESVEISNFKNVKYGKIKVNSELGSASILGLYGQNGSGKSALIDALGILKLVMSGETIPNKIKNLINLDSESCTFKYLFSLYDETLSVKELVSYQFSLFKKKAQVDSIYKKSDLVIKDEILSYQEIVGDAKDKNIRLFSTNAKKYFGENTKMTKFIESSTKTQNEIIIAKKLSELRGCSFIFSYEMNNILVSKSKVDKNLKLVSVLRNYAKYYLFTVDTNNDSYMSNNAFPMYFIQNSKDGNRQIEKKAIYLDKPNIVLGTRFNEMKQTIENMNKVLTHIMPGLQIAVKEIRTIISVDNSESIEFELYAIREKFETPLSFESEGTKKVIASLQLLIWAYNNKSVTIGIDEIDSGIFEYLLGEILHVFENGGKGQLFFTAHNLRPLETLNKKNIMFTTTNENNRYKRLTNIKNNNNLRYVYYREILLGNQSKEIYNSSSEQEIAFALREAGEIES